MPSRPVIEEFSPSTPHVTTVDIYGLVTGRQVCLPPLHHHLLDLGDGLGRVETLGAGLGAVHDRVAAVEAERVFQRVEPVAGLLVAAVGEPAIGLQEDRRPEIALAVPPI